MLCSITTFAGLDPCHKTTEGKDFWFGFMEGRNTPQYSPYTEVTLTSSHTCNYSIYIGKSSIPLTGTVLPNIPMKVGLDWKKVQATGSETIQDRAIHLVSDSLVNVYALNFAFNSSEVATIYPTESIGNEYYTMCYDPHVSIHADPFYGTNIQGKNSEFLIAASDDSTLITIIPSVVTDKLQGEYTPFQIKLSRGEVYQVQSANLDNLEGQGDLTGSYIKSDKPIAVFSGSYSTTIPHSSNSAYDHLYEQMPPLQTWGRKFIAVPLSSRHEDTYRILAAEDSTTVSVGNISSFVLNKGQFKEFSLLYTQPSLVESDKPILLAQFSNSNSVDSPYNGGDGDPFMVIVSPVNQKREKVAFVAYDSPEITTKFFINVVVEDNAAGKIFLDGNIVKFKPLTGSGYSYAQAGITKGSHYIESIDPTKGFIAYVYGFGGFEGYGYGVGYNLDVVLDVGGKLSPNGSKLLAQCAGEAPLTLNAGNSFNSYLWSTGDTTSSIKVTNAGWYKLNAATSDGCHLADSVEIIIDKPKVDLGRDTTICKPNSIVLNGGGPYTHYLWSTKDTIPNITAKTSGNYFVQIVDQYGCKAGDTIKVSFVNIPKMNLSGIDTLLCGQKSELLDISTDKGTLSVQRLSDNISFNDLKVTVPDFGSYLFDIRSTDEFSCYSDSTVRISFREIPSVDFLIDSTLCYQYNPLVKYMGNVKVNASDFIWIYGGDTISHGVGIDTIRAPIGVSQTISDLKLVVSQQGCFNSKILRGIKVIPKLKMLVVDSVGCEPFMAKFSATMKDAVTYDWDFGDGKVLSGSIADPSHRYDHFGYYPVKVKVTSNKGCINEIIKDSLIQVNPIPEVAFSPLKADCLDKGNNEISYLGSENPYDRYIWDLSKLDSEEIIQNPKETPGPLIFDLKNKPQANIGLKVISKFGCQSPSATILAKRKPDFTLSIPLNGGCPPFDAQFSASANDPVDRLTFSWDFGDGGTGSGNKIAHLYGIQDLKYDIVVNALSTLTGCSDTLHGKVMTYPLPKAGFSLDNPIVYNDKSTVHFTNTSTGASSFFWDFGDGTSSVQKDPSHDFAVTGPRTILLEGYNDFGCSDTTSARVKVVNSQFFPPNAFSPNAPELIDREFKLSYEGTTSNGYHLMIISRWSDTVFEVKDEIKGWDGRLKNGSFAPPGVYVWVLDFTDFLGRKHRQTGTVTLVF